MTKLSELTGDYRLDSAGSRIGFVVPTVLVSKVRGQFDDFDGTARLDGDDPSRSSVKITIQAKSIQTRNTRRDNHLRKSYLETADHPAMTFTSTKVEQTDETHFAVTGDLTIHGDTLPVTVTFELMSADELRFEGKATINRKDWGVSWFEAGGFFVGAEVTLELEVAAVRLR
ncbi:YceI family protein [Kribbella catacumbae]|uniref:YceI family protein n=1 Tax=Kribbella catacumbae TaxID=460086 RepID=UPI000368771E|nr:YceI family protein [Kribbella catacumbae]